MWASFAAWVSISFWVHACYSLLLTLWSTSQISFMDHISLFSFKNKIALINIGLIPSQCCGTNASNLLHKHSRIAADDRKWLVLTSLLTIESIFVCFHETCDLSIDALLNSSDSMTSISLSYDKRSTVLDLNDLYAGLLVFISHWQAFVSNAVRPPSQPVWLCVDLNKNAFLYHAFSIFAMLNLQFKTIKYMTMIQLVCIDNLICLVNHLPSL